MENFKDFMSEQIMAIITLILTGVIGWVGVRVKTIVTDFCNTKTKRAVAIDVVKAVEQMYKDLHGDEKLHKAESIIIEILTDKGIHIGDTELRMMIESVVQEFNTGWTTLTNEFDEVIEDKEEEVNNENCEVAEASYDNIEYGSLIDKDITDEMGIDELSEFIAGVVDDEIDTESIELAVADDEERTKEG